MSDLNDDFDGFDDDAFDDDGFDDDAFDDDNFDDNDDFDEPEPLTPQQEKLLERFQVNVKQAMRVVSNENGSVNNRIKAARWLGESGEPTAITALRQAYLNSPDKKIKKVAAESLGKFRALQESLDDPDQVADVGQLLQDIIFKGQVGSTSGAVRTVRRLQGLLVITFVLLMGVGVMASAGLLKDPNTLPTVVPTLSPQPTALPTIPPIDFLGDLLTMHDNLVFDAELLAERFQLSIQGRDLGCDVTEFRALDEYAPPEGFIPNSFPYVGEFIDKLNTAQAELAVFRAIYDNACETITPISPEEADIQWGLLIPLQAQLNTEFVVLLENPDFIPGETVATPTPRPSPTPFPTPTIEPSLINDIIRNVEFNIDDMNLERGKNTLLIQFWADLEVAGTTDACRDEIPLLPADYGITEEERLDFPIDLINAIESYNLGMALSRESWLLFEAACASESPSIQPGKSKAELAQTSFSGATTSLITLKE